MLLRCSSVADISIDVCRIEVCAELHRAEPSRYWFHSLTDPQIGHSHSDGDISVAFLHKWQRDYGTVSQAKRLAKPDARKEFNA